MKLIYATFPDQQTAEYMATNAIKEKLAACVNILPPIKAVYEWQGKLENSEEIAAFFKVADAKAPECRDWLVKNHPYDCPAVIVLPVESAAKAFERWIDGGLAS